ncbi:MAG: hypothetical protein RL086_637, partial [Bacteroidota bacterium]
MKILVIDNYDSFTFNVVQYLWSITGIKPDVVRNDAISVEDVNQWDVIILSPGPGLPSDAGIMPAVIREYFDKKPILGICLGHQAIGEAFGAELANLSKVFHGVSSTISAIQGTDRLFEGLPLSFEVGRYHSWVVKNEALPNDLEVLSFDEEGQIMAMKHKYFPVYG